MSPEFHFLRPLWLIALLPFWLLAWRYLAGSARAGLWARVCDPALLPFVLEQTAPRGRRRELWLLGGAGSLALVALAGPVWEHLPVPVFRSDSALVIALDLSNSMNAADLSPSRLARAHFEIADLLRLRRDGQTALVVYAAQSFVVTPLTDDAATLVAQLAALETSIMPSQGSAPETALERAGELLRQAGLGSGHVLLLTDGAEPDSLSRARALAADAPFQTSVLGLGTPQGAPIPDATGGFIKDRAGDMVMSRLDPAALAELAASGRGLYLEARADDSDVQRYLDFLDSAQARDAARLSNLRATQWREVGPWLLLPLLPLAAVAFRRGLLALLCAALLAPAPPAMAGWWSTPDQAGQRAWQDGDYAAAARYFANRDWRGAARYKHGDYSHALADFAATDNAAAHYNRGNALARLGRYEEALAAYDEALARAPGDADAAHNKALIEKLLAERSPPPPTNSGQDGKDEQPRDQAEAQPGAQPSDDQMSGGQDEQKERTDLSAGNAGGGSGGEEMQRSDTPPGERQAGAARRTPERAAGAEDEPTEQSAGKSAEQAARDAAADAEAMQATEQWLRQIPDDPAALLRRKFQYQYKQMYGNRQNSGERW